MNRIYFLFVAITILFSSWIVYYRPSSQIVLILYLISSLLVLYNDSRKTTNSSLSTILLGILLFWMWLPKNLSYSSPSLGLFVTFVFILTLFNLSGHSFFRIYKLLRLVLFAIIAIGVILFILDATGILNLQPIDTVFLDSGRQRTYVIYPFLVKEATYGTESLRFASVFDEPGYLGTLVFLLLLLDDFNLKDRITFVFFLAGLLSFSLAFYLLLFAYVTIRVVQRIFLLRTSVKIRLRKKSLFLTFTMVLIGLTFISSDFATNLLLDHIVPRFSTEHLLYESNRGDIKTQIEALRSMYKEDVFFFFLGNGMDAFSNKKDLMPIIQDSTWLRLIHQAGVLPLLCFVIFWLNEIRSRPKSQMFFLFFIISTYQRPQVFFPIFMFLLFYSKIKDMRVDISR